MEVTALFVAAERHGPMEARGEIQVEAGAGIVGDRWHGTRHRHVTVQSLDALAAASEDFGGPVAPESTRRNVTISSGVVPSAPGDRITIGEVELEVVRVAAPCSIMNRSIGSGGAAALRRRGGSVCRALSSGTVRLGDPVVLPQP